MADYFGGCDVGSKTGKAVILNNSGIMASALIPSSIDPEETARLHRKLSDCHRQQGLLDEAEAELNLSRQLLPDASVAAQAAHHLRRAQILFQKASYSQALDLANRVFTVLATTDLHSEVGKTLLVLGNCHVRLGNLDKADEFYQDALARWGIETIPEEYQTPPLEQVIDRNILKSYILENQDNISKNDNGSTIIVSAEELDGRILNDDPVPNSLPSQELLNITHQVKPWPKKLKDKILELIDYIK